MGIELGGIIVSSIVSSAIGALLGNFFNRSNITSEKSLHTFLAALSTDFSFRVENIVRAAFTEQNFISIKSNVMSAATAFRTYVITRCEDRLQLDTAYQRILDASSLLTTVAQSIIERGGNPETFNIADPAQRGKAVSEHMTAQKAAIVALQVIAALDFTILAKRQELYPSLNGEIVHRVDSYLSLARGLRQSYLSAQYLRRWIAYDHKIGAQYRVYGKSDFGDGYARDIEYGPYDPKRKNSTVLKLFCNFIGTYYKDGIEVDSLAEDCEIMPDALDREKRKFSQKMEEMYYNDNEFDKDAKFYLKGSNGCLKESKQIWRQVRAAFS